ncbi:MAG: PH domain-containing protein [Candidatus Berkelbacteria bacterium]
MPTQDKYFPSQEKGEKVFLLVRKHWWNYIPFAITGILMILPIIAVFMYWSANSADIPYETGTLIIGGLTIYTMFILSVQLIGFISYYLDVYIVTDHRIVDIDQAGLFNRKISELHLHQVQDVNAQVKGIFATLLHFGDVNIQTAGERENFIFSAIPNPYTVAKQIINLHEAHIEPLTEEGAPAPEAADISKQAEPDRGMDIDDIESQARELLSQTTMADRLKSGGLVQSNLTVPAPGSFVASRDAAPTEAKVVSKSGEAPAVAPQKVDLNNNEIEEGELTEGKEVDLK